MREHPSSLPTGAVLIAAAWLAAACGPLPVVDRAATLPAPPAGAVRIMAANAHNFFRTIDSGSNRCGPGRDPCRGADSVEEYERQRAKLVTTILRSDADIVALMEVENDAGETLADLSAALNAAGSGSWRAVESGVIGPDPIRVGILYESAAVTARGAPAVLTATADPRFNDDRNRPSLAQTFGVPGEARGFLLVVNHFKSKGSSCDDIGDPDAGDGQGNCNLTRTRAAEALADWARADPTGEGGAPLIVGDLNAYLGEDPVRALEAAGYENLLLRFVGADAYTYDFRGRLGALDHAFAAASLLPDVASVRIWHINTGSPDTLDYNLDDGRDPAAFDPDSPRRTSDHDPVVVDLRRRP